jgi:Flp pilus assembly protein protease CpaA
MILILAAPVGVSVLAAWWDGRTGLIPYPISGLTGLGAVALMATAHLPWGDLGWGAGTWAVLEGVTALHWDHFGAGDTTLLGALACWLGPLIVPLLAVTAVINLGRASVQWGTGRGWPATLRLGPSIAGATLLLTGLAWALGRPG